MGIKIDFITFFRQRRWRGWWWVTPCPKHYYYHANCGVCDTGEWSYDKSDLKPVCVVKLKLDAEKWHTK